MQGRLLTVANLPYIRASGSMATATVVAGCSRMKVVAYPEQFITPMREDLTRFGVEETRTPEEVDRLLGPGSGSVMIVINSVCGCAAGKARPGLALALRNGARPDALASVFAGFDVQATDRARDYFKDYAPSSPSIGILRNGELVYMLERSAIESRDALSIASMLTEAFDKHCATVGGVRL